MKLHNLIEARNTLANHANERVSVKLAYWIMKFLKKSEQEETFYYDKYRELLNEYAKRDENGEIMRKPDDPNQILLIPERVDEYRNKFTELENTEVDVPNMHFALDDLSELKLSAQEVYSLDELIVEEK